MEVHARILPDLAYYSRTLQVLGINALPHPTSTNLYQCQELARFLNTAKDLNAHSRKTKDKDSDTQVIPEATKAQASDSPYICPLI